MLLDQENKLNDVETLGKVGLELKKVMEDSVAELVARETTRPFEILKDLNIMDINIMIQLSHLMITTGVNEGQSYTNLAVAIGERIRNYYSLPVRPGSGAFNSYKTAETKTNSNDVDISFATASLMKVPNRCLELGIFILNSYTITGLIVTKIVQDYTRNKAKTTYKVFSWDKHKLRKLKKEFDQKSDPYKPLLKQADDWTSGSIKNVIGEKINIIKNSHIGNLSQINVHNTPIVLNAINKKQKIAYIVDSKVFEVYKWALKTGQSCFEHNSVDTIEIDRKIAKKAEAEHILEAAEPYLDKTFYQQYQADNRGRLYPLSAYLNELNSDNAKGMIKFAEGTPLGETGKEELFHHISNMYGWDKDSHKGRVEFVKERYANFADMGRDPYNFTGWMDAEEPFQFLQGCIELYKLYNWEMTGQSSNTFVSHTICYRDGSNNGLQWLFSLAKDEQNAHLVNIKDGGTNKPGDMYQYVANAVIQKISDKVSEQDAIVLENYDVYFKTIEKLRNRCREVELKLGKTNPISERKRKVIKWYQKRYKEQLKTTDLLYWNKAKFDPKTWRKIVKRNVMTYGYSATKQGMGEQIIQDTRDIDNEYLSNKQHSAARLLGSLVYNTIEEQFPKVSSVMKLFKDNCGLYLKSNVDGHYKHKTMISNFPFEQQYNQSKRMRTWGKNILVFNRSLNVNESKDIKLDYFLTLPEPNIQKAKCGISPNTIHNLDSLHLMLVIDACNFDIVSAHDSYGSRAGDIQNLNKIIREQFKRIIDEDPINNILNQTGNLVEPLVTGTLDSSEILNSEFAFA